MKALKIIAVMVFVTSATAQADSYVNGYARRDGTYVQPHYRSESNNSRYDNYSSQGNSNPYTGQQGYQRNEYSNQPAYNQSYGSGSGYSNGNAYDFNQ